MKEYGAKPTVSGFNTSAMTVMALDGMKDPNKKNLYTVGISPATTLCIGPPL